VCSNPPITENGNEREAPVSMPAFLFVLFGFMAGLLAMIVISVYRYLFKILKN
jgi:hypothetical protein